MFGYDLPRLHAAVNDLPAALLLAAVLFDLMGWILKRDSLVWAGVWTLWAGVVGGWAAVILGELAEEKIDHGEAIHEIMTKHERLALITMSVFTVVLVWKLWRRFQLRPLEARLLSLLAGVGFVFLVATGAEGGELVFDHAAGIPTAKIQAEVENREGGHQHAPGEAEDHDHDAAEPGRDSTAPAHVDPPGTPPHKH
ncbi:MAG TPA: DUF2231 domain-containing protein [Gemmatimonadales bacterium]|nr:DUF2231 domain-containing protein [Gemmatimonadales bacterium]